MMIAARARSRRVDPFPSHCFIALPTPKFQKVRPQYCEPNGRLISCGEQEYFGPVSSCRQYARNHCYLEKSDLLSSDPLRPTSTVSSQNQIRFNQPRMAQCGIFSLRPDTAMITFSPARCERPQSGKPQSAARALTSSPRK